MHLNIQRIFWLALALGLGYVAVVSVRTALPPAVVVIETGPVGGSYHDNALRYAPMLEAAGLKVEIRPNPQSLQTIDHLNADKRQIDIGFTVQALDRTRYPQVVSAGVVEMQPLFMFYSKALGKLTGPGALRGKRLVMPPEKSASAEAVRAVLALYGITPDNTPFTYLPIAQAVQALKSGQHDAGLFMLAPANKLIRELIDTDTLAMLPVPESVGVSRILDHLKPTLMPMGAFGLQKMVPDSDVNLISGTVNVMVRKDINPAVLYVLLDTMKHVHQGQTLVSAKGDFPQAVGTALDMHPRAEKWSKAGTPWLYANFGPKFASLIDKYWLLVLIIVLVANIYNTLHNVYEFLELCAYSVALRLLQRLQRKMDAGHTLGLWHKRLFAVAEAVAVRESQHKRAQALVAKIRPSLK